MDPFLKTEDSTAAGKDAGEELMPSLAMGADMPAQEKRAAPSPHKYELFAILVHSGTALGGHYKTYIKTGEGGTGDSPSTGAEGWCEFDDEAVRPISAKTLAAILGGELKEEAKGTTEIAPTPVANFPYPAHGEDVSAMPSATNAAGLEVAKALPTTTPSDSRNMETHCPNLVSQSTTNAYMLMYRLCGADASAIDPVPPPASVASLIAEEESGFSRVCEAFRLRMTLVPLRIHLPASLGGAVILYLPPIYTLRMATQIALAKATALLLRRPEENSETPAGTNISFAPVDAANIPAMCRLRRFNVITARPGLTFGGREDDSLADLGFRTALTCDPIDMLLEQRAKDEPAFAEYDPDDCHVHVTVLPVADGSQAALAGLMASLSLLGSASNALPPSSAPMPALKSTLLLVDGQRVRK